jgi:hypothetical protein
MAKATRTLCFLLFSLSLLRLTGSAAAGPLEDMLPPAVRQIEKRSLGDDERRMYGHRMNGPGGAAFSPDGKLLVTSTGVQGMTWYDVVTGRALDRGGNLGHNEGLSAAFTPDGKQVVFASWGGHQGIYPVTVWDAGKRQRLRGLDDDVNDTAITALAVSPDGKTVALGGGGGQRNQNFAVHFWDLASGDEIGQIGGLVSVAPQRHFGSRVYLALAYSPDGRTLAVLVEGRILLVELATGKLRGELTFTVPPERRTEQQGPSSGALAFSPDARTLAAGGPNGAIHRFDLRTGSELTPLTGHTSPVVALCWTRDGKRFLSFSEEGKLFTWRAGTGADWRPKDGALTESTLDSLWDVLRGDDPLDLFGCVKTLAASPAQTVPFLRKRLAPVPKADAERLERLVGDLQKGDYNARKRAVVALRKIGAPAAPALRRSQERGGYDPLVQRLMFEFNNLAPSVEQVRAIRALSVLERIGNDDAGNLLKELAGGAPEAAFTVQAKAALERLPKTDATKGEPTVTALWEALAGDDSAAAYRAIRALAGRPSSAAALRDRLKDVISKEAFNDDSKRVAKLIGDLDSDDFAVREQASKALHNLGRMIVPALRKALAEKVELEAKRRLEKILADAEKTPPPEILRAGRALEALELMGSAESREALVSLDKDVKSTWLRREVREVLRRQGDAKR